MSLSFTNFLRKIYKNLYGKTIKMYFNKKTFSIEINKLGEELSNLEINILALRELIDQINVNPEIYRKYKEFLFLMYKNFYDNTIHSIFRLIDHNKDTLSIVNILNKHVLIGDAHSELEKKVLAEIQENDFFKKIKLNRNNLQAHLNRKTSINKEKNEKMMLDCKFYFKASLLFLDLLKKALLIISERSDIPIILLSPNTSIKREIREVFQKLK